MVRVQVRIAAHVLKVVRASDERGHRKAHLLVHLNNLQHATPSVVLKRVLTSGALYSFISSRVEEPVAK